MPFFKWQAFGGIRLTGSKATVRAGGVTFLEVLIRGELKTKIELHVNISSLENRWYRKRRRFVLLLICSVFIRNWGGRESVRI